PGSTQSGDGQAVTISGDGNTIVAGGPGDNDAWVFTRKGSTWNRSQELIPSPPALNWFGYAAAVSTDGSTVIVGAPKDAAQAQSALGAAWVYSLAAGPLGATGGTPQATPLGMPFAANLSATVYSAPNVTASGVTVTFTAPTSGASGTFAGSSTVATAITDNSG